MKNTLFKSLILVFSIVIFTIAVSAVYPIRKSSFPTPLANVGDGTLDKVNVEKDFKFTRIPQTNSPNDDGSEVGSIEIFDDPKVNIYVKMLNSTDLFDRVYARAKTNMIGKTIRTIGYNIDIKNGISYQSVEAEGKLVSETYSSFSTGMVHVMLDEEQYITNYLPVFSRADDEYIPLSDRITLMDDGVPCYVYRCNITNCPFASYNLVPQEIAFSHLKDFDNWEITETDTLYLGRLCTTIIGFPSPYIATKHGIDSFKMIVDNETGILMEYDGMNNSELIRYMNIEDLVIDSDIAIKVFDEKNYMNFQKEAR